MSDDTENKEITSESVEPEKVETEPQVEEVTSAPEVVGNVPETTPEVIPDASETVGEASAEPIETVPETETAQMGGNEPLEEKAPKPEKEDREPRKREEKNEPPQKEKLGLLRQIAQTTIQLRIQKKAPQSHGTVCEANRDNQRRSRKASPRIGRDSDTISCRA